MKKINKFIVFILITGILFSNTSVYAISKKEIVYTKLNSDGSIKETIVSEKINNEEKLDEIEDYTILKDILNVGNDNTYKVSDNNITWNALGNDVFYKGTTNKSLPISMKVSYYLEDKLMDIDSLLGKKGNVTIKIKYTNLDKHGSLYTPFVVTLGTILDSTNNTNITISNGKIVSSGINDILVGIASPGLYESLGIDELKSLNEIEINFDTEEFILPTIYSTITPKLLDNEDLEVFSKLDKLYTNIDSLKSNMDKIEEGSIKLKNGSNTLKDTLKSSITSLSNNSKDILSNKDIESIKDKTLNTIDNTFTDSYKDNIKEEVWKSVKENLDNSTDSTISTYVSVSIKDSFIDYLKSLDLYNDYVNCETGKKYVEQGLSMSSDQTLSCTVISNDKTIPLVLKALTDSTTNASLKSTYYIAEKVSKNVSESISYETAKSVAKDVSVSVAKEVANNVYNASLKSLNELYLGVSKIDEGINTLTDSISIYNKEGITKINTLVGTNINGITSKIKTLTNLSSNYTTFTESKVSGEVNFLLVIDNKKLTKVKKDVEKQVKKESFYDKIKNLFK